MCISIFLFQSFNSIYHYSQEENKELNISDNDPELLVWLHSNYGFLPFNPSGNYTTYNEAPYLAIMEQVDGNWRYCLTSYDMGNISTLTSIELNIYNSWYNPDHQYIEINATMWITYQNSTIQTIYSYFYSGTDSNGPGSYNTHTESISLGSISEITLNFTSNAPTGIGMSVNGYLTITNLKFYGYKPIMENLIYDDHVKTGENLLISIDLDYINESLNQTITFYHIETGTSTTLNLEQDWFYSNRYTISRAFTLNGTYYFGITGYHEWNFTNSPLYTFYVGDYPQDSYLSLFSNLDGFPLESKDYKIYLGQDEEISLVNFRNYFGNWSIIYGGSVNASLIDNYIKIQGEGDGLTTTFENTEVYDTLYYNTLLFEIKVFNATRIVIIYNTPLHEKDYYIDFNANMTDLWYSIEIPFFLFNQYQNITNDWLSELGFWVKNTTIELSNIRIARHYNKTYLQECQSQLNMTDSTITNELYNETYINTTLLTFSSAKYESNSSVNVTSGYNCSGASWENITINTNSSINTNAQGNYKGIYPLSTDVVGTQFDDYTISIAGGSYCNIKSETMGHNHTIDWYRSGSSTCYGYEILESSHTCGVVSFWISTTNINSFYGFSGMNSARSAYYWGLGLDNGNFTALTGGSWQPIESLLANVWYKIDLVFCNDASGYFGLGEHEFYIYINDTQYGEYPFYSNGDVECINMGLGDSTGFHVYMDSIDYSWNTTYGIQYFDRIRDLIDSNAVFISDVINFNKSLNISNIYIDAIEQENNTLNVLVSDNKTGSFNNWINYEAYAGNYTQFLKYKILLNNTNAPTLSIFDNISFYSHEITYNCSQIFNISCFTGEYNKFWNSTDFLNIKTNDSSGTFTLSIYQFNESAYQNISFNNTAYELLNFTFDNNTLFDPLNKNTSMFKIYGNSTSPFIISINLMNFTMYWNKTLYSGEYNFTLLDDFEKLYYFYLNNEGFNLDSWLYNGSHYLSQVDLTNSSQWEKYNCSINSTWTVIKFNFTGWENKSVWIRELFEIKNESYRLISTENRQNPNELIFDYETESLAILDYFNNTLYRQTFDYATFIDIALPITTITFHNYYSNSIIIEIFRGLGTSIEVLVPPESSISLRIFTTSYLLHVKNLELQTLLLTEFSPDSSRNIVFEFGERQSANFPETDMLQNIMIIVIIGLIAFVIAWEIYNRIKTRGESKKSHKKMKTIIKNQNRKRNKKVII